jgi:two-component system, chemotaxis family, protein-glutamate methylesterase/glutaminase
VLNYIGNQLIGKANCWFKALLPRLLGLPYTKPVTIKHTPEFLVVIGASAGGFKALDKLVPQLSADINAAYCIVLHIAVTEKYPFLVNRLQLHTKLKCEAAVDGMTIEKGKIYIAQPGSHLLIKDRKLITGTGPEENGFRPSINVLFRSAAVAFRAHTIGIILTGMLQDGTTGMDAIRRCGGCSIVQDPDEADYPSMPQSVINNMPVDYKLHLDEIGAVIASITRNKSISDKNIPQEIISEARRSENMAVGIKGMDEVGEKSPYGCPDCGGVLWEIKTDSEGKRFRCHIGHAYQMEDLLHKQARKAETGLWVAVSMMEERRHLMVSRLAEYERRGMIQLADDYRRRTEGLANHIEDLKSMLVAIEEADSSAVA